MQAVISIPAALRAVRVPVWMALRPRSIEVSASVAFPDIFDCVIYGRVEKVRLSNRASAEHRDLELTRRFLDEYLIVRIGKPAVPFLADIVDDIFAVFLGVVRT